jgi:uncharacterized tellurite resistance protein B-like protein
LVVELQEELRTNADKDFATQALDRIIRADGVVTEREKLVAQEIRQAIDDTDSGMFGLIGKLIKGPVSRRKETVSAAPNREAYFEDYIKNRVYYGIKVRLETAEIDLQVRDQELRKLSLAAGLMARVAKIDQETPENETNQIVATLNQEWGVEQEAAEFVTEVALAEISPEMDYYRLTRGFFECTSEEERIQFLDVLFAVAAADGYVSSSEIEEIRALATGFKLPHKTFINAKIKIPRELRAN